MMPTKPGRIPRKVPARTCQRVCWRSSMRLLPTRPAMMIALQLPRESYEGFPDSTAIDVKPEQLRYLQLAVYQCILIKTVEKW